MDLYSTDWYPETGEEQILGLTFTVETAETLPYPAFSLYDPFALFASLTFLLYYVLSLGYTECIHDHPWLGAYSLAREDSLVSSAEIIELFLWRGLNTCTIIRPPLE